MYLRHTFCRKNGKVRQYWKLVRSVRCGRKVRQEVVAYLGSLTAAERRQAAALSRHFLGERAIQQDLFEVNDDPIHLASGKVAVENGKSFGDIWMGWRLWQALELDKFFDRILPAGREKVSWADLAMIMVVARLCDPSSELHIAEDWYRRTAFSDVIGIAPEDVYHTRLYRALDEILPYKNELEIHLKDRLGTLFNLEYDLLLYDVTSTYFEGQALRNPLAQRGYSRDSRPDCKQVCIGLVVTRDGFPIGHEIFAGNTVDVTTTQEMVATMEAKYGIASRVWVMDRGMVSEKNLQWLRDGGREYLVGTPRSELKKWQHKFLDAGGWDHIRDDLEVKLCQGLDSEETFILCRSQARLEKEKALHERFTNRIKVELESLSRRLENAKKKADRVQVERQIGRIFERNSRGAGKFTVRVEDDKGFASTMRLVVDENREWSAWNALTEGTYILRTNVKNWTPEELWRTYIQLTEAEAAFRIQKSDLRIRPIWHHREDRVRAHILVCFISYVLWKTMSGWQQRAGLGSSPRTIFEELHRIQSVDVVLPLMGATQMKIRCVVRPDKAQEILLGRLGLVLPKRVRASTGPAPM